MKDIIIALTSFTLGTFIFLYWNDSKLMEGLGNLCILNTCIFILKPIFAK